MKLYDLIEASIIRHIPVRRGIASVNTEIVDFDVDPRKIEIKTMLRLEYRIACDPHDEAISCAKKTAVAAFDDLIYGELRNDCRDLLFELHHKLSLSGDYESLDILRQLKAIVYNPR